MIKMCFIIKYICCAEKKCHDCNENLFTHRHIKKVEEFLEAVYLSWVKDLSSRGTSYSCF